MNVHTVYKILNLLTGRILHVAQSDLAEREHILSRGQRCKFRSVNGVVQVSLAGGRQVELSEDDSPPARDCDAHDTTSYPMKNSTR